MRQVSDVHGCKANELDQYLLNCRERVFIMHRRQSEGGEPALLGAEAHQVRKEKRRRLGGTHYAENGQHEAGIKFLRCLRLENGV
ncbi:MAG TPA: hypothetical protein VFN11_06435 [Ktedonobacterales bacterium]|nr:hypothetical protein [Ktedonobacterales bacterium]